MWRTARGERTLGGAEAALVRASLAAIYITLDKECLPRGEPFESGVAIFDRLEAEQQLAMLATVGEALLCEHIAAPPLDALSEATAAAIFGGLQSSVEAELDVQAARDDASPPSTAWRLLLRDAVLEAGGGDVPPPNSTDWRHWNLLLERVAREVLGIGNWRHEDVVVDCSPENGDAMKEGLQVTLDYFDAIAPDPQGDALRWVRRRLDALTGRRHADGAS